MHRHWKDQSHYRCTTCTDTEEPLLVCYMHRHRKDQSHYLCATCTDTEGTWAITSVAGWGLDCPPGRQWPGDRERRDGPCPATPWLRSHRSQRRSHLSSLGSPCLLCLQTTFHAQHGQNCKRKTFFLFLWFLFYFLEQMRQNNSWYIWPIADLFFPSNIYMLILTGKIPEFLVNTNPGQLYIYLPWVSRHSSGQVGYNDTIVLVVCSSCINSRWNVLHAAMVCV